MLRSFCDVGTCCRFPPGDMFASGEVMRNPIRHVLGSLLVICLVVAGVYADGPEVVRTGSFPGAGASAEVRAAVEEKGYRVTLDDGWTAEFWFSRALATATKDAPSALYPELTSGELV